ncbi:MAG TPA: twin-arginine translocase subunit TatC [Pyrinomonadaceae bacterium]|jgi:sec-independent protein translocase protein TatC
MSTSLDFADEIEAAQSEDGGRMSLFEHLDELRRRLGRSFVFVCAAFVACWVVSDRIYNFLAVPITTALADARRAQMPAQGLEGGALPLASLPEGSVSRYVFAEPVRLAGLVVPPGASALARVARVGGRTTLLTEESLIVGTATEPFSLYLKVSLCGAFSLSVPFLLLQVWGFISPGLHRHERGYVLPFVSLVAIMVAAAVLSPTGDVLNMLLFAAPMAVLYLVSIFVAWLCARPRTTSPRPR